MRQAKIWAIAALAFLGVVHTPAVAEEWSAEKHEVSGFLDFNVYPYTLENEDNAFTLNALANLKNGFQYFSLTNYGRDSSKSEIEEFDGFFTEQNIRWSVPNFERILQASAQAVLRSGDDNDIFRLGMRWALHGTPVFENFFQAINLRYWLTLHGAQFDHGDTGYRWQIEHAFRIQLAPQIFDNRVYIGGFADQNIEHDDGTRTTWVEEAQLGVRLIDEFYFVAEQRHNGFRRGGEASLGLGLEYVVKF